MREKQLNCRDWERQVQDLWDRAGALPPFLEPGLGEHAAHCADCGARLEQYRDLWLEIADWRTTGPPSVPTNLADRILAAHAAQGPALKVVSHSRGHTGSGVTRWLVRGAAAALILSAFSAWWLRPSQVEKPDRVTPLLTESRPLSDVVVDATTATLELAWTTSAPAARLGREWLGGAVRVPSQELPRPHVPDASAFMESMGSEVREGIRPLSGTARRAFGFLAVPRERSELAPTAPRGET